VDKAQQTSSLKFVQTPQPLRRKSSSSRQNCINTDNYVIKNGIGSTINIFGGCLRLEWIFFVIVVIVTAGPLFLPMMMIIANRHQTWARHSASKYVRDKSQFPAWVGATIVQVLQFVFPVLSFFGRRTTTPGLQCTLFGMVGRIPNLKGLRGRNK
jgi:hypothetical protein